MSIESKVSKPLIHFSGDVEILDAQSGLAKQLIQASPTALSSLKVGQRCRVWIQFRGYHAPSSDAPQESWTLFDDNFVRSAPLVITVGKEETIPGLETALSTMTEAEKSLIIVPPSLAFGAMGNPMGFHGSGKPIPADSYLFFDVQLVLTEPTYDSLTSPAEAKEAANHRFALGCFTASQILYEKGLEMVAKQSDPPMKAALTANLMAALLKGSHFEQVRNLGEKYLADDQPDPSQPLILKIIFRLAKAHIGLARWTDADATLQRLLNQPAVDATMQHEIARELKLVKDKLNQLAKAEKNQFNGLFDRMAKDPASSELYSKEDIASRLEEDRVSRLRECPFCHEKIDNVQYPRHIIKYHSNEKSKD